MKRFLQVNIQTNPRELFIHDALLLQERSATTIAPGCQLVQLGPLCTIVIVIVHSQSSQNTEKHLNK